MTREPEACRDRQPVPSHDWAICHLLTRVTQSTSAHDCLVQRDACIACCGSLRGPGEMNPVVASLTYNLAREALSEAGRTGLSPARARTLLELASDNLSVVLGNADNRHYPPVTPPAGFAAAERTGGPHAHFRWATALLTAPRRERTIETTLVGLERAGFTGVEIFAEPGSWIPETFPRERVTVRSNCFGNFLNFYDALTTLLAKNPTADAYAVFQDDIEAAVGLRDWCETQLWPHDNGLVSLFTPRLHSSDSVGWRIVSPGVQRVCGAQALVFRPATLREFLADPHVVKELSSRRWGDDAVLGAWMAKRGSGMAYHTPSPVQHVGTVSSLWPDGHDLRNLASAVSDVREIPGWRRPPVRAASIGVVGWNTLTGLGSINRDLVRHLGLKHWLCPPHPQLPEAPEEGLADEELRDVQITRDVSLPSLQKWVRKLDWLVFAERPYVDALPHCAANAGVGIACIPMWEWVRPDDPWLAFVDLMICPTHHTAQLMRDWKTRYGYDWRVVEIAWPVDTSRFPYRERRVCREFLFINGWGGGQGFSLKPGGITHNRKGLSHLLRAAELAPDLRFVVRSLAPLTSPLPANVRILPPTDQEVDLYHEGDVCVQPSLYEGLGLQLLECQAAGLPLVTTAAPPMNELHPWRTIPTRGVEVIDLWGNFIPSAILEPADLVETLRPLVGADLREASRSARTTMENRHSWGAAVASLRREMVARS